MDPLFAVFLSSLLVWGGLFFYLMWTESRVRRLEQRAHSEERE